MSADEIRRAAAKVRELAEAATPGPWECYGDHLVWPSSKGPAANDPILAMVGKAHQDSAQHIASWHPTVALAVADWLDDLHGRITDTDYDEDDELAAALRGDADVTDWPEVHRALVVARQILGEA